MDGRTLIGEGNQQHRVNHPRWGLDNWVCLAYVRWTQVPEYADYPFAIEAGRVRLAARFPSTGGWGMWQRKSFGRIDLAAGRQRIVLRPDGPIQGELSDLREVHLVPVTADK